MKKVKIVEVGLRDGLQNEKINLSTDIRFELAQKLIVAGAEVLEAGAFVSPKWVPQMAGSKELIEKILQSSKGSKKTKTQITALVPNEQGMHDAIASGVTEVAIFAACSESFSQKNINCSIDESFNRFAPVMKLAKQNKMRVRGYLSTCFGCPYEGAVSDKVVLKLVERMFNLEVYEVSVGDTIGIAHAAQVEKMVKKLKAKFSIKKLAGHYHDTRGQALTNIKVSYDLGMRIFDTSLGGLGGCPYAPGSAGNVATEDVVYMFDGMGVDTNLDLNQLIQINKWLTPYMQKELPSKVSRAAAD